MKANDSVLCLNRILHIHSRRETHIISREHASARIQAQALKLIEWGCGQFAGALRTLSHGVMGGTVMQGYRVEIYIQHPSSPFTLQKQKKTLKKIEADKHPPWDWKLRAAAAGILTAILASRSLEHSLSFSGGDRDPANSPTNCVGLTFPIALCNNNHCLVISPRCHQ